MSNLRLIKEFHEFCARGSPKDIDKMSDLIPKVVFHASRTTLGILYLGKTFTAEGLWILVATIKKIFVIYNRILVSHYSRADCAVTFRLCLDFRLFF